MICRPNYRHEACNGVGLRLVCRDQCPTLIAMSRSSEEVLLSVPHVRHKKTDGTLYLMGERLGWMVQSKKQNAFSVVLKYADVKSQKISPEGKPKIQLQVPMLPADLGLPSCVSDVCAMCRGIRNPGVRRCLGFWSADSPNSRIPDPSGNVTYKSSLSLNLNFFGDIST